MSSRIPRDNEVTVQTRSLTLSDQLHRELVDCETDHCYLMYDQTMGSPVNDEVAGSWAGSAEAWRDVPLRHPQVDRSKWPLWLPIDVGTAHGSQVMQSSISAALLEARPEALHHGTGRRIGGWLTLRSGEKLSEAAVSFGRSMLQTLPQGATVLLRLCDPAVLWALWPLLDAPQQAALLGSARCLWLLDPAGWLCKLESQHAGRGALVLRVDQWRDVMLIQPLNEALRVWLNQRDDVHDDPAATGVAREISMQALRRGLAQGLIDRADLAAFAGHALSIHARFDEHPAIQELLQRRVTEDEHYTHAVESFTDADWQKISEDLSHAARA